MKPSGSFVFLFSMLLLGLLPSSRLLAQEDPEVRSRSSIIDDSTKQIYGPTTTRYFLQSDIFLNRWISYPLDTAIWNFHRFTYLQKYSNFYQDLGNTGTASRPVYEQVPGMIGATAGFTAYDLYWNDRPVTFYNTRSPYSRMNVILGGKGRSITNVDYSRNINPRWNFGFHYNGLFIDKQIQRQGKGDRNVKANYYDIYTSYHNKDSTYTALVSFRRMFHRVLEYGGVRVDLPFTFDAFFRENAQPWLVRAEGNELRRNYRLYHQYSMGNALQLYHQFDSDRKQNRFYDDYSSEPYPDFFDAYNPNAFFEDSLKTRDQTKFRSIRNEAGIKGNLLKLFYNGYVAWRNFNMNYRYLGDTLKVQTSGNEFYIGGRMVLKIDSLTEIRGHLESMLDDRYKLQGSVTTRWFAASINRAVSTPTFMQQAYRGRHDEWNNDFSPVESSEIRGNLIVRTKSLAFFPGFRLNTFRNLIFFKEDDFGIDQRVMPVQSSGYQTLLIPEVNLNVKPLKNTTVSVQALYTRVLENADDALQVPELFINAQLAYANIWVHGNFDFQVGVDVHWKSSYFAYGYDPVVQQFYTQQQYKAPDFPLVDVFLNVKIIRGRIFFKYNNLAKAFTKSGQVPTPFYPGVVNTLDFGFDWMFFD